MLKIYVQNKPLFLINSITQEIEDYVHRPETIFIDELSLAAVKTMLQQLEQPEFYTGVFLHANPEELINAFKSELTVIQAAGGLVYTKDKDILLIFRKGKWDLPKGKIDEGEEVEACALREIEEETGVSSLQIIKPLQVTYHTYHERGKHILKESHWFLMKTEKRSPLIPQMEEDIQKAEWVPLESVKTYMDNMHASIIDVINIALEILWEEK